MDDATFDAMVSEQADAMDSYENPVRYVGVADVSEQSSVGDY